MANRENKSGRDSYDAVWERLASESIPHYISDPRYTDSYRSNRDRNHRDNRDNRDNQDHKKR